MGRVRDALKKVPWKTAGLVAGIGAVAVVIFYFGLVYPDAATDPVARGGVATHERLLTDPDTGLMTWAEHTRDVLEKPKTGLVDRTVALETAVNDPATGLAAKVQKRADEDTRLGGLVDTEVTARTDGDNALGTRIATEVTARTTADTALSAAVEGIAKALHDPANPGAGVVGRLIAVEEHFAPPPPVPPADQVGIHVRRPVR